jgi:hypothetical protein
MLRQTTTRTIDFSQIFGEAMARFQREVSTGHAELTRWRDLFRHMHELLVEHDATPQQCEAFRIVIRQAMDRARGQELSDSERAALLNVLWAVFSRHAFLPDFGLTPRSDFLRHVVF